MGRSIGALKGLPGWPLMLAGEQAAAYVGLTPASFQRGVSAGELPPGRKLVGELRWSRPELERWLDNSPSGAAGMTDTDPLFDPVAAAIDIMEVRKC